MIIFFVSTFLFFIDVTLPAYCKQFECKKYFDTNGVDNERKEEKKKKKTKKKKWRVEMQRQKEIVKRKIRLSLRPTYTRRGEI